MKVFTIIQGIRIRRLLLLVLKHGLTPLPIYLLRFLVLLQGAIPSSILTRVERLKYGKKIRESRLEKPPVFIVGHWRTGSTYLHQLMNLHPELTAPTMVQTSIPDHFLFSTPYYIPILKKALPSTRPMDNVHLDPFAPQEEEFAILRLGADSPMIDLLFPRKKGYFLSGARYIPEGRKLELWKKKLRTFYVKIQLETGKQLVSKNPWHSLRMPLLTEMFPDARFIHITRDPMKVVPSTIHMWNIVARDNALKKGWKSPSVEEVSLVLREFMNQVRNAGQSLPADHYYEICFEDLEKDPVGEVQKLFQGLDLDIPPGFVRDLRQYASEGKKFRKNQYSLNPEDQDCIRAIFHSAK